MKLVNYLNDQLEYITTIVNDIPKNDVDKLFNFIKNLLDPNFILDAIKGTRSTFIIASFENLDLAEFAREVNLVVKTTIKKGTNITKAIGLDDPEAKRKLQKSIENLINKIKRSSVDPLELDILDTYIQEGDYYYGKLEGAINKTKFSTNKDTNIKLQFIQVLNIMDLFFARLQRSERDKVHLNMSGLRTKSLKVFITSLMKVFKAPNKMQELVGNYIAYVKKMDLEMLGGKTSGVFVEVSKENSQKISPASIPKLTLVELPEHPQKFQYETMANLDQVPVYRRTGNQATGNTTEIVSLINAVYNPNFIFETTPLHKTLAEMVIKGPDMELFPWATNTKDCINQVITWFGVQYPEYGIIRTTHEEMEFTKTLELMENQGGSRVLEVKTFYDLLRIYNVFLKYGLTPENPDSLEPQEFNEVVSNWLLELLTQSKLQKENSIKAYPFVRAYIAEGGKLPDPEPKLQDFPTVDKVKTLLNAHGGGGFFVNAPTFLDENIKFHTTETSVLNPTGHVQQFCAIYPNFIIKYVVYGIFGFVLARNYANYKLYFDMYKQGFYGGSKNSGEDDTVIDKNFIPLYRDIIILGSWYFSKIHSRELPKLDDRWSRVNEILFAKSKRGGSLLANEANEIAESINDVIKHFLLNEEEEEKNISIKNLDNDISTKILNDYIASFHVLLCALVESSRAEITDGNLPLDLSVENLIVNYNTNLNAYAPIMAIDSGMLERYRIDMDILARIYKKKNRYVTKIRDSDESKKDIEILINSLGNDNIDNTISIVVELYEKLCQDNDIVDVYANKLAYVFKDYPVSLVDTHRAIGITKEFVNKAKIITTPMETKDIVRTFDIMMIKRITSTLLAEKNVLVANLGLDRGILERNISDCSTIIAKAVEDFEIPSMTTPYSSLLKNIFNNFGINKKRYGKLLKEYLILRYHNKIPYNTIITFELLLENLYFIKIFKTTRVTAPKILPVGSTVVTTAARKEFSLNDDDLLYNEVMLINSRVNVVRTAEFIKLPPLYFVNVYYNYFVNFRNSKLSPIEQANGIGNDTDLEIVKDALEIFTKGYEEAIRK